MMGDTGGEGVWSFLGARHGGLGSVGSHTGRFIAIYIVRVVWREEARGRSKLVMIGRLMDYECKARCVEVDCKRQEVCW